MNDTENKQEQLYELNNLNVQEQLEGINEKLESEQIKLDTTLDNFQW